MPAPMADIQPPYVEEPRPEPVFKREPSTFTCGCIACSNESGAYTTFLCAYHDRKRDKVQQET